MLFEIFGSSAEFVGEFSLNQRIQPGFRRFAQK